MKIDENRRLIFGETLEFNPGRHFYTWKGNRVPGVTTVLNCVAKPVLVPWAVKKTAEYWLEAVKNGRTDFDDLYIESKKVHRQAADHAASIGTNVHNYAECFFKNLSLPELKTDEAKRSAEAFHDWVNTHRIKTRAIERRIYSREYNYAGTCDIVAEIDGVLGIGDYKTSSGIYPEMRFQTAAYQHALQEEKGIKFEVRWIIRFDKVTGQFEAKPYYDFESDFSGFKGALALYRSLEAMKERKEK